MFLFDGGLRCPSQIEEGACQQCASVAGVATLGTCFCPWSQSVAEKDAAGKPCFVATLAKRREQWQALTPLIEKWETDKRQYATLAGLMDEHRYDKGYPCLSHPSVADAEFLREHYEALYDLAESFFARDALDALANMELIASAGALPKIKEVPQGMNDEISLISAIAKANEEGDAAFVGDGEEAGTQMLACEQEITGDEDAPSWWLEGDDNAGGSHHLNWYWRCR